MAKYKIVASDLDGTLFDSNGNISCENLLAIKALYEKGVQFVPSTGRSLSEIPKELTGSTYIRYYIYSNGSVVYDKQTGSRSFLCMSNTLINNVLDIICSYDIHFTVRQNGKTYVDIAEQGEEKHRYFNLCRAHSDVIKNFSTSVPELEKFSRTLEDTETVAVFFHKNDELQSCRKRLTALSGIRIVDSWENNLELFSSDAGKGNALKLLSNMIGVGICNTIAVGDSDNDTSMIKEAGLGLAVKNACDCLRKEADEVICTNDEHCIDYILLHCID